MRITTWKQHLLRNHGSKSLWSPTWNRQCSTNTCSKNAHYLWVSGKQNRALCEDHAIAVYVRYVDQMENGVMGLPRPLATLFLALLNNVKARGLTGAA